MTIIVMNRKRIEEYCRNCNNTNSILISISNIGGTKPDVYKSHNNKIIDILRLEFNDVDYTDNMVGGIKTIHAKKIKKFINKYKNIKILIVQCEAGQSRSAGVAAAILKYLYGDDTQIFSNRKYTPNMLCYSKVLHELMGETNE